MVPHCHTRPMLSLSGEFDLGSVESPLPRLQIPGQVLAVQGLLQGVLGLVPELIRANAVGRAGGELVENLLEAEVGVDPVQQVDKGRDLGLNLVLGAENMGIVLGEAAHPHQAVQRAGLLVAVTGAELGQPQRQVAVALQALVVDLDVARAVHRLDRERALLRLGGEHVVVEFLPVAGFLPQ